MIRPRTTWQYVRAIGGALVTLILLWALAAHLVGCAPRPQDQRGAWRRAAEHIWRDVLRPAVVPALEILLEELLRGDPPSATAPADSKALHRRAPTVEASPLALVLVRSWARPAVRGQRVRLAAGPDGRLLVASSSRTGGRDWRAVLEDCAGQVLEQASFRVANAALQPVRIVGAHLLTRDAGASAKDPADDTLLLGGELVARGNFEAYAALPAVALAFPPGGTSQVLYRAGQAWQSAPWGPVPFGLDLGLTASSTDTVAIASRELPNKTGWDLRLVDQGELEHGRVQELEHSRWAPKKGLSLEDPLLVPGAAAPTIVGTAFDTAAGRPSGRLFVAELGGSLREVGEVAPVASSYELAAVELDGRLYLAAEVADGRSAVYRVEASGLVHLATVPGGWPAIAAAQGQIYLGTTAGLWRSG